MNKPLTLGSLFDGSGGFPLAGLLAGIVPVWSSEIEPFAIRVTEKRLPQVQHFGNISGLHGAKLPPVDIITFGSPCQDMSIAGKRTGLNGSRSSLFHEAIRIIREMRCASNGKYPRYIVWENVPGAFSSNGGEDFRCVLEAICSFKDSSISIPRPAGKWTKAGEILAESYSLAWRVLDAQYWGVPQRRKRIFLVADFDGASAGKILFESEGLSRYSPQSFRTWQAAAGYFADSVGTSSSYCLLDQGGIRMDVSLNKTGTLRAQANHPPCVLAEDVPKTLKIRCGHGNGGRGALIQENISATLATNNDQTLFVPKAYGVCARHSNSMLSDNPNSGFYEAQTSRTIDTSNQSPDKNQGGIIVLEGNGSRPSHRGDGYKESETMYTLNTVETHAICTEYLVRRLTPQECALLQGLPPWWCENLEMDKPTEDEITYWQSVWNEWNALNGKQPKSRNQVVKWLQNPHSDAAEYMMYGNAICMSCGFFVLSGIAYFAENPDV